MDDKIKPYEYIVTEYDADNDQLNLVTDGVELVMATDENHARVLIGMKVKAKVTDPEQIEVYVRPFGHGYR